MAFAASLTDLQAEASCPICLDLLRDPVTIECGHNFCCSCITQRWEDLQDILPCPVCLHHCPDRNFKKNTQLCHMTEVVMQLPTRRSRRKRQEEKPLCEKHHCVVTLFCEKDLELLCPQCRVSPQHSDHQLVPLEQAAAHHRKELKNCILSLRKGVEDAENGLERQVSRSYALMTKVEHQRLELYSDYEQLKKFLGKEQDAVLLGLMMEEKELQEKLIENNMQMSAHISILKNRLSEITEKCVQTKLQLLADIGIIYRSCENLKTPAMFSYELKKESCSLPPQYFGLKKMISSFKADLTLDPETAHRNLIVSDSRKSVTCGREEPRGFAYSPKRFTSHPAVVTSEGFDCARHFWQVEIRGRGEWSLGVCKDSFPRNGIPSASPKDGCWQIHQWSNTCDALGTVKLIQIGIFLDYDLGEISFYNMGNRSHIYTFTDTFTEKLWPYFSTGPNSTSLSLRIITDEW